MPVLRQIAQIGRPVLRQIAEPVADPTAPEIASLVEDMMVTVDDASGVGIAAPQVHASLALFIVCPRPNPRYPDAPVLEPIVMVNPEILWKSEETERGWEGCLSVPGIRGVVERHTELRVRYLGTDGRTYQAELSGFIARIFQHEYDHIQGMLFLDRADPRELATEKEYLNLMDRGRAVSVQVARHFDAPAERVFDAWFDPSTVGKWLFATPTGEMVRVEIDPKVGGVFTLVERREGEDVAHTGTYLEIERPRRLSFAFKVEKYSDETTTVTVEIKQEEEGCALELTHDGVWEGFAERTREGWVGILEGLAKALKESL